MRDQARAFIRPRRTAQGTGGYRERNKAPVVHGFELLAQQHGLLTRLPGMGHFFSGCLVVAGQRVESQIDAGRQHQTVIGERTAVGETDNARLRIDPHCRLSNNGHAFGDNPVVGELLCFDFPQASYHLIAERTGGEGPVRFDQCDQQFWIDLSECARTACTAKAAADHDDAYDRLCVGRTWERKRCC